METARLAPNRAWLELTRAQEGHPRKIKQRKGATKPLRTGSRKAGFVSLDATNSSISSDTSYREFRDRDGQN